MTDEYYYRNLRAPAGNGMIDMVLDTDAFNEADDQFAIAYMLRSEDRLRIKGICAAPFSQNVNAKSTEDAMNKSYDEIRHILHLAGREDLLGCVYKGSTQFMSDDKTPIESDAAHFMAELATHYTAEHPLYIVAIGASTNVASALLLNPLMKESTVIIWLGGNAPHIYDTWEYNMAQDIPAARVLFGCGAPFVQLPCSGSVDHFITTWYELEHFIGGKNPLCDYLMKRLQDTAEVFYHGKNPCWSWVIWDVTAVAWLLNDGDRFMTSELIHSPIPNDDHHFSVDHRRHMISYVNAIKRDALYADLFKKLAR